jgi:hypothetical protein
MNYAPNKKILETFYDQNGISNKFDKDNVYLEKHLTTSQKFGLKT